MSSAGHLREPSYSILSINGTGMEIGAEMEASESAEDHSEGGEGASEGGEPSSGESESIMMMNPTLSEL